MSRKKVVIIGGGNVGASVAHYAAQFTEGSVELIDIVPQLSRKKTIDFNLAKSNFKYKSWFVGHEDLKHVRDADIVVHTAGLTRKPGMDRLDLLRSNVKIARAVSQAIAQHAPNAVMLIVANPLDIIAMTCFQETGFPKERIIGMAGVLDAARNCFFIAEALGKNFDSPPLHSNQVQVQVLGGHGDTMVPLTQYSSIGAVPIEALLDQNLIENLQDRTCRGGAEIVGYLKTGSAFHAPAASTTKMLRTLILGERQVLPASVYLEGEYGYRDIFLGVPAIISSSGVEKIIELSLSKKQKDKLAESVKIVQEGCETLKGM